MHRPTAGILAILLLAGWAALWFWPLEWELNDALQGALGRVGLVLGALWLALPQLNRVPTWFLGVCLLAAMLVALQPRRAILLLPVLLAIWLLRPRGDRNRDS